MIVYADIMNNPAGIHRIFTFAAHNVSMGTEAYRNELDGLSEQELVGLLEQQREYYTNLRATNGAQHHDTVITEQRMHAVLDALKAQFSQDI